MKIEVLFYNKGKIKLDEAKLKELAELKSRYEWESVKETDKTIYGMNKVDKTRKYVFFIAKEHGVGVEILLLKGMKKDLGEFLIEMGELEDMSELEDLIKGLK